MKPQPKVNKPQELYEAMLADDMTKALFLLPSVDLTVKSNEGKTFPMLAAENNNVPLLLAMIKQDTFDASIRDGIDRTLLMYACGYGLTEVILPIAKAEGSELDAVDWHGYTATMYAVYGGHTDAVS